MIYMIYVCNPDLTIYVGPRGFITWSLTFETDRDLFSSCIFAGVFDEYNFHELNI